MATESSAAVVRECQQNFNFLPIESQLEIRTAKFLQAFAATKNTLCLLFKQRAVTQLDGIFGKYNVIRSAISTDGMQLAHYEPEATINFLSPKLAI